LRPSEHGNDSKGNASNGYQVLTKKHYER
jgi:hypothetical protein